MSRSATGQFKESGDVSCSLKQDRQQKAETKSGQGGSGRQVRCRPLLEPTRVCRFATGYVVLSALLFVLMRGCSGPPNAF